MADTSVKQAWRLDPEAAGALALARHGDPFAALGPHDTASGRTIRAFLPGANRVEVLRRSDGVLLAELERSGDEGLFENLVGERAPYRLRIFWPQAVQETEDPYSFGLLLGDVDLHLLNEGRHFELDRCLGAQNVTIDGVSGVRFAVWAPNATRVAVVGDFNSWDRRRHPMRVRHGAGVWELFIPRVAPGTHYKYDIVGPGGYVFVTVPYSYPHHRDPIDTMFRPRPEALAELFRPARMLKGEILDVGRSYLGQIKRRPWILLRHISRFPFPFIGFGGWKRSMAKLYWLFHNYQVSAAAFQVPLTPPR